MTWQGLVARESLAKALHGQNDNELFKSAKTFTLSYTVTHSSFLDEKAIEPRNRL